MNQLNIAIVDDHEMFAEAISNTLPIYGDFGTIVIFNSGEGLLTFLETNKADIVLLDLGMQTGLNGFETLTELKKRKPSIKVIVISMHTQSEYIKRVKELGGNGYLTKDSGVKKIKAAIDFILRNDEFYLLDTLKTPNPFDQLSETELRIVKLLLTGKSNTEIADKIFRSAETINSHRKNIYKKLGVSSVVEFVKLGMKFGITSDNL